MLRSPPAALAAAAAAVTSLALVAAGAVAAAAHGADVAVAGSTVHVEFDRDAFSDSPAVLVWVRRAADIVAHYYGRFPAAALTLRIVAVPGEGVHGGQTFADPDPFIRIRLGREVTEAQLLSDWVLVHEMTHLAAPDTGEMHAWLSEGLATYVEGVARVQAGNRSEADVWAEQMRAMPQGLPRSGDHGLDHTHSWGRTYWGGAMFCLMADVDIRRKTHDARGLQDAVRAIARASGGLRSEWPIERVLATGDAAVGTTSLEDLYARMKDSAYMPDLVALWRELGVVADGDAVRLTDEAPLAGVRHAIMTGTKPRS